MVASFIDIHPHVISDDESRYPHSPLFGVQSKWSSHRPVGIDGLIEAMDANGVRKAAVVQASTCYGYDNSYLCDSVARFPGRFTAVGAVDLTAPDAPSVIRGWVARGISGVRVFTGGSTRAFDNATLDNKKSFPAWEVCGELGLPICLQTVPSGHAQVAGMAKRFPQVKIVLDHLSRPEVGDGPPYHDAASLFALAAFENIYLKVTPRAVTEAKKGKAATDSFFPKLVAEFGSSHLAWGSNYPSTAPLKDHLDQMREALTVLSEADQEAIFVQTAQSLYPALRD